MDKDLEVISIFGQRGSGKTTKAKELLASPKRKRVIIYDIKAEYPFQKIRGLHNLAKFLKTNFRKDFKISYVPEAREKSEQIRELSKICYALVDAQRQEVEIKKGKNLTILVEEMSMCAPNQKYQAGHGGFEYAVNVARDWGIEIIGVSQRPAQVNTDYRGNASLCYYFGLADELDIGAVASKLGKEKAAELRTFQPHDYYEYHRGNIKKGKNKL